MTKLIGTGANQVPTNADLGKLAYQDAIANGTGTAGQVLQSGGATAAPTWATVSSGYDQVQFPSDWTSPDETFNSSGTYTKPSGVADDDYIWIYLLGGGGSGCSNATYTAPNGTVLSGSSSGDVGGSPGGQATLLYGKAKLFHGGGMVVAGSQTVAQRTSIVYRYDPHVGFGSSFTLSSSNGGVSYSTNSGSVSSASGRVIHIDGAGSVSDDYLHSSVNSPTSFSLDSATTSALAQDAFGGEAISKHSGQSTVQNTSVFGAGNAGARPYNNAARPTIPQGISVLAGDGGVLNGAEGQFPGGAGRSLTGTGTGGTGQAGQIRIYHV